RAVGWPTPPPSVIPTSSPALVRISPPGAVEQIDDTPPRNSSDTSLAGPTVRIPFAPPMSQLRTRLQHPSPNPMALRIVEQRSSLPAPGSPIRSSGETAPPLPEFAPDSLLEEAVRSELVSEMGF